MALPEAKPVAATVLTEIFNGPYVIVTDIEGIQLL